MIGTVLRERICAADVEAVQLGQHHVEHDEVEVVLVEPVERLVAVERAAPRRSPPCAADRSAASEPTSSSSTSRMRGAEAVTFGIVGWARDDRAARLQGGVHPGAAGAWCWRCSPSSAAPAAAAAGTGRRRPLRRPRRRPSSSPRIADRASPTAARAQPRRRRDGGSAWRASLVGSRLPGRAPALHPRGPRARERDRPPRRRLAAPDRGRGRARRGGRPGRARQRLGHRRAARAGAGLRGPAVAEDARAGLGGRLDARRGRHRAARRRARPRRPSSTPCSWCRASARGARRGPLVQAWSNDARRAGIGLQRTVAESIRAGARASRPAATGALGQLARLAFPLGIGPQGVLLAERLRRGADLGQRRAAAGRATARWRRSTRTRSARSAAPRCAPSRRSTRAAGRRTGPSRYLLAVSQVLPGLGDLAARRRRCCCPRSWRPSTRSRARAAGASRRAAVAALARRLGRALPGRPGGGRAARAHRRHADAAARARAAGRCCRSTGPALGVLGGVAAAMLLAFALARWLAARPDPALKQPGAARAPAWRWRSRQPRLAAALARSTPTRACSSCPAAHLWMLAVLTRPRAPAAGPRC